MGQYDSPNFDLDFLQYETRLQKLMIYFLVYLMFVNITLIGINNFRGIRKKSHLKCAG